MLIVVVIGGWIRLIDHSLCRKSRLRINQKVILRDRIVLRVRLVLDSLRRVTEHALIWVEVVGDCPGCGTLGGIRLFTQSLEMA